MHEKYVGIAGDTFSTRQKHFLLAKFLTPKNIYIDTNCVTLTALELKLWHKRWFPDFDGGHFENGPKQVVHPNFSLLASTFDIRGGPMNNKNLVSDCPGGGAR